MREFVDIDLVVDGNVWFRCVSLCFVVFRWVRRLVWVALVCVRLLWENVEEMRKT